MWGGSIDGILAGNAVYNGRAFGVFEGEVPDGLDSWVGTILSQHLHSTLEPGPELLAKDLGSLSQALTDAARDELAAQGVDGIATVTSCSLKGEQLEVEEAAPAASPSPMAAPVPTPPVVPPIPPPTTDLNETAAVGQLSPLAKMPLPFRPAPGGAPRPQQEPLADDHVLPFVDDLPDLSVEQYASLCVERTLNPETQKEVAQRYRILTAQALRTLDDQWRQRFAKEGELQSRWQQAYTQYETWLRSQKG